MTRRLLNVGCGKDIRPKTQGWTNMDIAKLPGVDVVHNLLNFPWPFSSASYDEVFCSHILEHIPHTVPGHSKDGFILVMEEIYRIPKPGGLVRIFAPHHLGDNRWKDPTHTGAIHPGNFHYFEPESNFEYYSTARFRTELIKTSKWLHRGGKFFPIGRSRFGVFGHLWIRVPSLEPLFRKEPSELYVELIKVGGGRRV